MRPGGVCWVRVAAAAALLGAAPADPLLALLLAGANAVPPAALRYDRVTAASQTSGGKTERLTKVERWDGKTWSLVSVDGVPPSPKAAAEAVKAIRTAGVPGYYRLAQYLAAGPVRGTDAQGRVTYRLDRLPPGSVTTSGANPDKFAAELSIDTSGAVPFIRHARYYAPAPMRLMMVAKLERFEAVADYRLSAAGRPELARQVIDLSGTLFGRSGEQHSEATYTYR